MCGCRWFLRCAAITQTVNGPALLHQRYQSQSARRYCARLSPEPHVPPGLILQPVTFIIRAEMSVPLICVMKTCMNPLIVTFPPPGGIASPTGSTTTESLGTETLSRLLTVPQLLDYLIQGATGQQEN